MKKLLFSKTMDELDNNRTIKEIIKEECNFSNRIISNMKNNEGIIVNGHNVNINHVLKIDDYLELSIRDEISENIIPEEMNLDITFEDEYILLVNKPPGLVVHPTTYNFTGTLANGVMYYLQQKGENCRFRPVNRLDKDTSGLVLIAKDQLSHSVLSKQLINKSLKKEYIAIVHNEVENKEGLIEAPIARKPGSIIERCVSDDGQVAITAYKVIDTFMYGSILEINLITGRTHQIRVHFSYIGHPLYGDALYGGNHELIERQALHCTKLEFMHPINKKILVFSCPIPNDIKNLTDKLKLVFL